MSDPPPVGFSLDSTAPTPDSGPLADGSPRIPERFAVGGELGRGGMGVVFDAHESTLDRQLAVKVSLSENPVAVRRFQREARIAARLDHPGVVPIYELGEDDGGRPFFTMKKIGGQTLTRLLRDRLRADESDGPTLRRLMEVYLATCQTVAFAHARGVIHRDLKPQNVMVGEFGEVLVVDWGLAKFVGSEDEVGRGRPAAADQTAAGQLLGTPSYMAPEQARGEALTPSADIYALGGILFEVLTGRTPFQRKTLSEALTALESEPPPRPSASSTVAVPKDLEAMCLRCLAKTPAQRYPDVEALIADVRAFLDDLPVSARRPGPVERFLKWSRRHPGVVGTAALGLTLLLASSGVFGVFLSRKEQQRADEAERRLELERGVREAAERRARASGVFSQALELQRRRLPAEQWLPLLDKAIALDSEFAEPRLERADALRELNRPEEALAELDEAVRLQPANSRAYLLRGLILRLHLSRYEESRLAFEKAAEVDPNSPFASVGRAMALVGAKREREVDIQGLERLAREPTAQGLWELHFARGFVYDQLDRPKDAAAAFREAARIAPRRAAIHANHAAMLHRLGQHQEALAAIDKGLKLSPKDANLLGSRGTFLVEVGRAEEALKALDASLKLDPKRDKPHVMRGIALMQLKRPGEALQALDRAIALRPDDSYNHMNRGIALRDLERYPEALAAFDQAVRLGPDWRVHVNRGLLLALMNRVEDAIAAFERAPNQPEALAAHGSVLYGAGRHREAIPCLQRTVEADPKDGQSWRQLANSLMAVKRYKEAAAAFTTCVKLKAQRSTTPYRLGVCQMQAGAPQEAIAPLRWASEQGTPSARGNALTFLWLAYEDTGRALEADAVGARLSAPPVGTPGKAALRKAQAYLYLNRAQEGVAALRVARGHEDVKAKAEELLKALTATPQD